MRYQCSFDRVISGNNGQPTIILVVLLTLQSAGSWTTCNNTSNSDPHGQESASCASWTVVGAIHHVICRCNEQISNFLLLHLEAGHREMGGRLSAGPGHAARLKCSVGFLAWTVSCPCNWSFCVANLIKALSVVRNSWVTKIASDRNSADLHQMWHDIIISDWRVSVDCQFHWEFSS